MIHTYYLKWIKRKKLTKKNPHVFIFSNMNWVRKLNKTPYKYMLILFSRHDSIKLFKLFIIITSALNFQIRSKITVELTTFGVSKKEVLVQLQAYIGFFVSVNSFDFCTLHTNLLNNVTKKKKIIIVIMSVFEYFYVFNFYWDRVFFI